MIRTRNFVLVLLSLVFVFLAFGITSLTAVSKSVSSISLWVSDSIGMETDYTGEVPPEPDEREERLASLRAKVAERLTGTDVATAPTPTSEPLPSDAEATSTPSTEAVVNTCSWYTPLTIAWSPSTITQENREGMRVYFEAGPATIDPNTGLTVPSEVVRARIPLRTGPSGTSACLSSDVIGIAVDGSLIRNDEKALYTVFGGDTLVGYALDGFPIYGVTPGVSTDQCGGAVVGGTYRYVLDGERAGLINCFGGAPITLR